MAAVTCHRARVLMLVWLSWVYESAGSMLDGQRRNERAEEERGGKGRGRARGTEVWFGRGGPSGLAMTTRLFRPPYSFSPAMALQTARVTSSVVALPPRSGVSGDPALVTRSTARMIRAPAFTSPKLSSMKAAFKKAKRRFKEQMMEKAGVSEKVSDPIFDEAYGRF